MRVISIIDLNMKKIKNCIVGEVIKVMDYTEGWYTIQVHPTTFYRRINQIHKSLNSINGLYAEIDYGSCVCIRFSDQSDGEKFRVENEEYI